MSHVVTVRLPTVENEWIDRAAEVLKKGTRSQVVAEALLRFLPRVEKDETLRASLAAAKRVHKHRFYLSDRTWAWLRDLCQRYGWRGTDVVREALGELAADRESSIDDAAPAGGGRRAVTALLSSVEDKSIDRAMKMLKKGTRSQVVEEALVRFLPRIEEDETLRARVTTHYHQFYLSDGTAAALRALCTRYDWNQSDVIRDAVADWVGMLSLGPDDRSQRSRQP